eukprot:10420176-Karenia_brevis.AAC.1
MGLNFSGLYPSPLLISVMSAVVIEDGHIPSDSTKLSKSANKFNTEIGRRFSSATDQPSTPRLELADILANTECSSEPVMRLNWMGHSLTYLPKRSSKQVQSGSGVL